MERSKIKMVPKPASALGEYPKPSSGMMSSCTCGIALHASGIGWQVAIWNNIKTGGENFRCQKIALTNGLRMEMMQNIETLMVS